MKSSDNPAWAGIIGLVLAASGIWALSVYRVREAELEAALRLGYARPAAQLSKSKAMAGKDEPGLGWLSPLDRALRIQLSAADRLRVDFPQDQDLILLETDVMPRANYALAASGEGWEIRVEPWVGTRWSAPSNSGAAVLPAAYPANGRIAYYDIGRIWISDLNGLRMQSLQHVPLLESGGQLYWDYGGTRLCWMGRLSGAAAVDLATDEDLK